MLAPGRGQARSANWRGRQEVPSLPPLCLHVMHQGQVSDIAGILDVVRAERPPLAMADPRRVELAGAERVVIAGIAGAHATASNARLLDAPCFSRSNKQASSLPHSGVPLQHHEAVLVGLVHNAENRMRDPHQLPGDVSMYASSCRHAERRTGNCNVWAVQFDDAMQWKGEAWQERAALSPSGHQDIGPKRLDSNMQGRHKAHALSISCLENMPWHGYTSGWLLRACFHRY